MPVLPVSRGSTLMDLLPSFQLALRAAGKARRTVETYSDAVYRLDRFLSLTGASSVLTDVSRRDIEAYTLHVLDEHSAGTASVRFRSLRAFFNWTVEEGELQVSPMQGLKPPHVSVTPVQVLTDVELRQFLTVCAGTGFRDRRDHAVTRMFIDTGARLSEVAGVYLEDVDLDDMLLFLRDTKGRKPRTVPLGDKTALALDRYLRLRHSHRHTARPELWLAPRGPLTSDGLKQMVARRAKEAGLPHVHAHTFRHTFASRWLEAGGSEGDLMRLCGWSSRAMLDRYGAATAVKRAQAAYRTLDIGSDI